MRVFEVWGDLIRDGLARLRRAWGWIVAQFIGMVLLIALGLGWTRVPEKYGWQVALTFVLPLVIIAGFLWLQAGTMRAWLREGPRPVAIEAEDEEVSEEDEGQEEDDDQEPRRVLLAWGAVTLILWIAIGCIAWWGLDHLELRGYSWSGYVNSKLGPHARATWGSYNNVYRDFEWGIWALKWVVVPGLLVPLAVCAAAWGLIRTPWRRGLCVWRKWNWWPVVVAWALIGEAWPQTWFSTQPHGTVHEQVWRVVWKLAGWYLLAVLGWNKVVGWAAMLVDPRPRTLMDEPYLRLGLSDAVTPPLPIAPAAEEVAPEPEPGAKVEPAEKVERVAETEPPKGEPEPLKEEPGEEAPQTLPDGLVGRPLPQGSDEVEGKA